MDEKDVRRVNEVIKDLTEAARESYKAAVDQAFAARESNMSLARSFFEDWTDTLEAQAELNRRTMQRLVEQVRRNQEVFRKLSRNSLNAYDGFLDSLYSYYEEVSKEPKEPGG